MARPEGGSARRLRGVLGWLPALLLVPAGMTVAAQLVIPTDREAATRTLYPLDAGTTWVYAVSDHGKPSGTHTRQVTERGQLFVSAADGAEAGTASVRDSYTDYPGQGPRTTSSYFASNGRHIDQYGVTGTTHEFQQLEPPAKVYEAADVGAEWSYHGTIGLTEIRFTTKVTDHGSVTAGGRRFEGCTETVTTFPVEREGQPTTEEVVEEWTCPGVGPVSSSDRYDASGLLVTEELVAFHGRSGSWASEPPPEPAGQPASTSSLGFDEARTDATEGELGRDLAWTLGRHTSGDVGSVAAGSTVVTGDNAGWVSATDVATGEQVWQVRLAAPILTTPAVSQDAVLVAGGDKRLWALSLTDGSTRWVADLDDVVTTTPSVSGSTVVVATDDGTVSGRAADDGSELWSTPLAGRLTSATAVHGGRVFACDQAGNLTAIDVSDGAVAWSRTVNEGSLLGPSVAGGLVLAQDEDGIVYAFDEDDGGLVWESRTRGLASEQLAVTDDVVVVALDTRELDALDLGTGRRLWSRAVPVTDVAPVIVGDQVVTVSSKGRVGLFGVEDGTSEGSFTLPSPVPGLVPNVDQPLGLADGALLVTAAPNSGLAVTTTYAYPLAPSGRPGLLLDVDPRPIPSVPTEPVTELGDGSVLLAGFDGSLVRVDGAGRATTVLDNQERIATGGVMAGDVVIGRRDDRLEAVSAEGGDPVWSIATGNSYAGSVPAVSGATVYAGTSDGRLLAVAVDDGSVRWTAPVDPDILPKSPLVLADGDVVYGVGLARYDAASGRQLWSVPGAIAVGTPVQAGQAVIAVVTSADGTNGLGAWDVATGRQLWFVPGLPESYLGPAVGDGTVVWVDGFGTVQAFDATSGTPSWSMPLNRPAAGVPVIRDGRVYLAASGRAEDFDQRDFRVLALDLGSGRFLGSWEPPSVQNWIVPAVGPGLGQPLLVPTGRTGSELVEVGPHG
jgi:YD repeat-containing protein